MPTPILICDDSSFARKQVARALPNTIEASISYATNGAEALVALRAGKGGMLFLDLNMPVMDGYEVLQAIRDENLHSLVIVISGDIQPEAYLRVLELGALEFIKKPVDSEKLSEIMVKYGLKSATTDAPGVQVNTDIWDCYAEVANIAMGRAADLLARLLGTFVQMPVPKLKMIQSSELNKTITVLDKYENISVVSQGFIGFGIAGEALLIFNESSFTDIAELMHYDSVVDEAAKTELLMDIGSIMIGAFLKGISSQLDITFSQGSPSILDRRVTMQTLKDCPKARSQQLLAIELRIALEGKNIKANLLLLFTEDSIEPLNQIVSVLAA